MSREGLERRDERLDPTGPPGDRPPRRRFANGRLIAGLVVIGLGLWLLLLQLDVVRIDPPWEWWPLILVALGLGKLLGARSHRERIGGVWLMALGGWLIVNFQGWFGLYWDNSWPLLMVAAGALIAWRAMADPGGGCGCRRRRSSPSAAAAAAPGEEV